MGPPQQQQQGGTQPSSSSAAAPASSQKQKRPVVLSSEDKLFENLRDTNFAIVGNLLNKVARRLNDDYEVRHQAKTVSEIREFVSKLGGLQQEHQSLRLHTGLAEEIMKHTRSDIFNKTLEVQQSRPPQLYLNIFPIGASPQPLTSAKFWSQTVENLLQWGIKEPRDNILTPPRWIADLAAGVDPSSQHDAIEELIARNAPVEAVLRLICIESLVGQGLKPKDLENFKREILQAYGYHHVLTLDALEKLQLLQSRTTIVASGVARTSYSNLRKVLKLIVDEVNEHNPDDIAYVYSGYAPLSIRLVQCIIQKPLMTATTKGRRGEDGLNAGVNAGAGGWRGFEDVLKSIKGKTFDEFQRGEDKALRARNILNGQNEKKVTVVFFVGGCTFTEIAALRFIGKREEGMLLHPSLPSHCSVRHTNVSNKVDDKFLSVLLLLLMVIR